MATQQQHFSFPLLKVTDLRELLAQLEIAVSEDDLYHPSDWKVRQIFEKLIEKILNKSREDYGQVAFHAAERLEFPELHEDSVPMIAFYKLCQLLLGTAGAVVPNTTEVDFSLQDLSRPDKARLRKHLSAVSNFIYFINDKEPAYVEMAEKTALLREQKEHLEQECERLDHERKSSKQQREAEQPEVERLKQENEEKTAKVAEIWNQQTELHTTRKQLSKQVKDARDATSELRYQLLDAEKERDELKAQVVPDARKLKHDLAALQSGAEAARNEVRSLELAVAQHAKEAEVLERAEQALDEALGVQAECEAEQAKIKETQRQLRECAERATKTDSEKTDTQHQIKAFTSRIEHARAALERAREQQREKLTVQQQAHADAQQRWAALEAERAGQHRQLDENEALLREVREKLHRRKMDHETDVQHVVQQQNQLAGQVRAYHQDLLQAMKHVKQTQVAQPLAVAVS